jgi:hypothetical protein
MPKITAKRQAVLAVLAIFFGIPLFLAALVGLPIVGAVIMAWIKYIVGSTVSAFLIGAACGALLVYAVMLDSR